MVMLSANKNVYFLEQVMRVSVRKGFLFLFKILLRDSGGFRNFNIETLWLYFVLGISFELFRGFK